MVKLWSIARTTFLQTIRQPIYMVLVLATFGLLVASLPLCGWTLAVDYHESDQQMLQDVGLGTLRVAGLLIAAFSASAVLRREIEEKTALTVIAKPVPRAVFVLGKFAGVTGAVALACYLCCAAFLMTVRHRVMPAAWDKPDWVVISLGFGAFLLTVLVTLLGNLWFGWPFTSTAVWSATVLMSAAMGLIAFIGKDWRIVPFGYGIPRRLILELVMMLLAVVIFSALAITASTRLGEGMTLLACIAVFLLGSAHPLLIGRWAQDVLAARVAGWIVPNFTYFYPQDDLRLSGQVPLSLVGSAAVYCALYSAGVLALGVALFQTRELEAEASPGGTGLPPLVNLLAWGGRALALAGAVAALVLPSLPRGRTVEGLTAAGGLLAAAVATWLIWGAFARGARWSYWVVLGTSALAVLAAGAVLLVPALPAPRTAGGPALLAAVAALAAGMILIQLLPNTRRHFHFRLRRFVSAPSAPLRSPR